MNEIELLIDEAISDVEDIKEGLDDVIETLKDVRFAIQPEEEQNAQKFVPDMTLDKVAEMIEEAIKKMSPTVSPSKKTKHIFTPVEPWDYQPRVVD